MLAVYGPGGFGRELIPVNPESRADFCFISDNENEIGKDVLGIIVYSLEEVLNRYRPEEVKVVIAVGAADIRRALADRVRAVGLTMGNYVAPTAVVGAGIEIGAGAVLCNYTVLTASARIGRNFHSNIYSYVAHDCYIGDFVTLAPRVCINGNTIVEDDVYIGTGAILKQGTPERPLRIGKGAVIGMGAVVTKDVAPKTIVVGNPARPLTRS